MQTPRRPDRPDDAACGCGRTRILDARPASVGVAAEQSSWPQWRGPTRDGVATIDVPATWPRALTRKWDAVVGAGHSSPVIAGTRIVVHTRQGAREVIAAYDLRHRRAALAGGVRRAVPDESGRSAARSRAQVHSGDCRRSGVRARDRRRPVGARSRDRQSAVADAGGDDAAAVRHGDLSARGRRARDCLHRRARSRGAHGVRCRHGRGALAVDG